ncbi:hypothetical protein DFJ58DRAFT_843777 [Suillus subalutaceus]|uniref:uncharacterized protein n=1 Tax=Suillus subalutaceus TaxID=48586 RepID=UPI001B87170B|nr:uncharacterized protein DFJ58DRAFT_843777 [Suillus subalutaceus]KAG1845280.1 hypothetical protein DFJ58DRAFT_843777 [Suillus subalutaceus]
MAFQACLEPTISTRINQTEASRNNLGGDSKIGDLIPGLFDRFSRQIQNASIINLSALLWGLGRSNDKGAHLINRTTLGAYTSFPVTTSLTQYEMRVPTGREKLNPRHYNHDCGRHATDGGAFEWQVWHE